MCENVEECLQKFSEEDFEYFEPMIARYRPLETTLENVEKCDPTLDDIDLSILGRSIFSRLQILNEYAYTDIVQQFTESGDTVGYLRMSKLFKMAICLEFWKEYFHSPYVSLLDNEIRGQFKEKCIALSVTESASYTDFKKWVHSYAPDPDSKILYFEKFHKFRFLLPNTYRIRNEVKYSLPFSPNLIETLGNRPGFVHENTADEEQKMLCRIYLLVERMIHSRVTKIHHDFDLPEILTLSTEKRELLLANARALSIAYAIWSGYKPPLTPKSLLFHIIPRLIMTREMVLDALDMFQ